MIKLLLILCFLAAESHAQQKLYVIQSLDESAACIQLETGTVDPNAITLGNIPNDIIGKDHSLYVSNSGYNNIQEIDATTNTTLREIQIPGGVNVWSMAILNGDSMAVTCSVSNNVIVIRLSDEQVIAVLSDIAAPQGILCDDQYLYVCATGFADMQYGPSYVLMYDKRSLAKIDSLPTGTNAQNMALDEQGRLHVVCTGNYADITGEVHVIDVESRETVAILEVGGAPSNISIAGDLAYLAAGGWGSEGFVFSYRVSDLQILHDESSPLTTAPGAFDIEALTDGSFYVSCFMDDLVEFYDVNGELQSSYEVSDGPGQMLLFYGSQDVDDSGPTSPRAYQLAEPYPNPFNGTVNLGLQTRAQNNLNIIIYNSIGQTVRHLRINAGSKSATWNARDDSGSPLSSGIYYYLADGFQRIEAKRLIYMK